METTHINYIEFTSTNLEETKAFYSAAFGWSFVDYGPEYAAFSESGVEGGFAYTESMTGGGNPLVILYHTDLKKIRQLIIDAGGKISKDIYAFPGGRRFHFFDPSGNELAVWSDQ